MSAAPAALQRAQKMLQQQLRVLRAREAQSRNPGQSAVMQHRLGEELVQEAKEAVAKAKAAKAAGDKAGCDHIMRHLKYTWHPGMSPIVHAAAFAWPWGQVCLQIYCGFIHCFGLLRVITMCCGADADKNLYLPKTANSVIRVIEEFEDKARLK